MAITIGNVLLLAATVLSTNDFESVKLGAAGIDRAFGGGDHSGFVTNLKAHSGKKSFCFVTGPTPGAQALRHHIFGVRMNKEYAQYLKSGYLRFSYWFCPETANALFYTELRTNKSRNLNWLTNAQGFRLNCAFMPKKERKLPDWNLYRNCELGKWHKVEIFIPVNPDEKLNAKMQVTWPDGKSFAGESDYLHIKGTSDFIWTPMIDQYTTNSRFYLDDLETAWVTKEEAP